MFGFLRKQRILTIPMSDIKITNSTIGVKVVPIIHVGFNHVAKVVVLTPCHSACRNITMHMSPDAIVNELSKGTLTGWEIRNHTQNVIGW